MLFFYGFNFTALEERQLSLLSLDASHGLLFQILFKLVNLAIVFLANIVIVVRSILAVLTITRYFLLHEETLMLDAIDIELLIVRRYVVTAFPTSLFVVTE